MFRTLQNRMYFAQKSIVIVLVTVMLSGGALSTPLQALEGGFELDTLRSMGLGHDQIERILTSNASATSGVRAGVPEGLEEYPITSELTAAHDPGHRISALRTSHNGHFIGSVGSQKSVQILEASTMMVQTQFVFLGEGDPADIDFSPDGTHVAVISNIGEVQVWDLQQGVTVHRFDPETGVDPRQNHAQATLKFRASGEIYAAVNTGVALELWNVGESTRVNTIHTFANEESNQLWKLEFGPEGHRLVAPGDRVRVWDVDSSELLFDEVPADARRAIDVAISPDGHRVAAGGWNKKVEVWEIGSSQKLEEWEAGARVHSVGFSEDSNQVAFGTSQGRVALGTIDGETPVELGRHDRWVDQMAFNPHMGTFLSAGDDRILRVWGPDQPTLQAALSQNIGSADWQRAVRLYGLLDHPDALNDLFGFVRQATGAAGWELQIAILTQVARSMRERPLTSQQWGQWFGGVVHLLEGDGSGLELPYEAVINRLELVFVDALFLEGPDLEVEAFAGELNSAIGLLWSEASAVENAEVIPIIELLEQNRPKDQLAHVMWALALRPRFGADADGAHVISRQMMGNRTTYQDIARIYELLHRHPAATTQALQDGARITALGPVQAIRVDANSVEFDYDVSTYWETFQDWLLQAALMRPAFAFQGNEALLVGQLAPAVWYVYATELRASMATMDAHVAAAASEILEVELDSSLPIPFADAEHFDRRQRYRYLLSLLYQAEHKGESLALALGAYYQALQRDPSNIAGASQAAERVLLARTENPPSTTFLQGPGEVVYVADPTQDTTSAEVTLQQHWDSLIAEVSSFLGQVAVPGGLREPLAATAVAMEVQGNHVAVRKSAHAISQLAQRVLDETSGPTRPTVQDRVGIVRQLVLNVLSHIAIADASLEPVHFSIRVERDVVDQLLFSHPSLGCLDCMTGLFRIYSQYYATNTHHRILTAVDQNNPERDPPLARLTIAETVDGALIATNALNEAEAYSFLPAFVNYLQLYAQWVGRPAYLPVKFFEDQPGAGWEQVEITASFEPGADAPFHFDLALTSQFPYTTEAMMVWRFEPPEAQTRLSVEQRMVPLQSVDQLLRARSEAQVNNVLLNAVQNLGFEGAFLYELRPARGTGNTNPYEIRALARTEATDSYAGSAWTAPRDIHAAAIASESGFFHISRRSEQPYDDDTSLQRDADLYASGVRENVEEVYYQVLRDGQGQPWGLLLVNNWRTGAPLLLGPTSEERWLYHAEIERVLETLGVGAWLALENARQYHDLGNFMHLQDRSSELSGRLAEAANRLSAVAKRLGPAFEHSDETLTRLQEQASSTVAIYNVLIRETLKTVAQRREPRPQSMAAPGAIAPEALSHLGMVVHDFLVELLPLIQQNQGPGVIELLGRYEEMPAIANSPGAQDVLQQWQILAISAIQSRANRIIENNAMSDRIEVLAAQTESLGELVLQLRGLERKKLNGTAVVVDELQAELEQVETGMRQLVEELRTELVGASMPINPEVQLRRSAPQDEGAQGLEEKMLRSAWVGLEARDNATQLLVVERSVLNQRPGLEQWLGTAPQQLGPLVIFESADQSEVVDMQRWTLVRGSMVDLGVYLAGREESESVGYVGSTANGGLLQRIMPMIQVTLFNPAETLAKILAWLGVPTEVLEQLNAVGMEELFADARSA